MEGFRVLGGQKIRGTIAVDSAKNAVLPILAAAILSEGTVTLRRVPDIRDVQAMGCILRELGCSVTCQDDTLTVQNDRLAHWVLPDALSKQIRSSIFLLGPILARLRRATVPYPGGCEIGLRPIDLHLKGLQALGVTVKENGGLLYCDGTKMHPGDVYFDYPSVGATENVMMAAVFLPGTTTLHNAAREPEIADLQAFLQGMGAAVEGAGTPIIRITGVKHLHGLTFTPMPDRIVAGTLLCAAAITGGEITLTGVQPAALIPMTAKLREMDCRISETEDRVSLAAPEKLTAFAQLQTQPHPGFPTDMQAQMLATSCLARGASVIVENVFENRFGHVGDLCRMGAHIRVSGRTAVVEGVEKLYGMPVTARDLRGGAALVLAGLAAEGETLVENAGFIDRGYAHLEQMLKTLGAQISRVTL